MCQLYFIALLNFILLKTRIQQVKHKKRSMFIDLNNNLNYITYLVNLHDKNKKKIKILSS